jgi:uncharacterized membrane protein YfhO
MVKASTNKFITGLILNDFYSNNKILYYDITPFTNALLNIRYLITSRKYPDDNNIFWETAGTEGDAQLLENKYYLPLGFMVNGELSGYTSKSSSAKSSAESQNDFFRRATGLTGDLVTATRLTAQKDSATYSYEIPSDGMLYFYLHKEDKPTPSGQILGPYELHYFSLGYLPKGQTISFKNNNTATEITAIYFNSRLFERGYALLSEQPLKLTKFTGTAVCGNVTALRDGLLYTSIPGDKNWSVFVDGVKSKLVLVDGAMACVRLNKGYHEVEFRYLNKSFLAGIIVSLVSLAIFVSLAIIKVKMLQFCATVTYPAIKAYPFLFRQSKVFFT